ncbi:glycine betaine/L-proline ABC transporter ATP-binding protein [Ensifer sp. ENS06]|uniref:quaternary amine ABC transporter ATP-binding protein n=1 Tax=Ensifer sp. ENS06 TaxID=2769276 RepID=UPI00177E9578|nr:glycine betaine/L-proline ABC transporter ATP-binding protein [Ensifer sp. ENS06]MBD9628133.1 glycine betaine/L-proline ABC transporter ATP-binding protein [Ensifer sp. ENS06]
MANIEIRNVYKVFGAKVPTAMAMLRDGRSKVEILAETRCSVGLNDVNMSIGAGQIFVIMGLSGSGKSTLVRHLNRLIEPTSGELLFDGQNIVSLNPQELRSFRTSRISMVFQSFGLFPHRTVLQNVMYGQKIRGTEHEQARAIGKKWIDVVGLSGYEDRYPFSLSGGMKQRVGLARALAADTDVILMDEAFSALDPLIRSDMQDQLLDLQKNLSKTIVFITHDLDEALKIGSEISILKDGQVVQCGTPDHILSHPADDYVARFVKGRQIHA